MDIKIVGDNVIITLPFDKVGQLSASKKSKVHASTKGNIDTPLMVDGKPLTVGVNAYTKA